MIKVINVRAGKNISFLFNYAHFICDCVFPEFAMNFHSNENITKIIRLHKPRQSIGNFKDLYKRIIGKDSEELNEKEFENLNVPKSIVLNKYLIPNQMFVNFRNYIWKRFKVTNDPSFPKIILVKRGKYKLQYKDKENDINMSSGSARREIADIDLLETKMQNIYGNKFQSVILQNNSFERQVKYFFNANIIVMAHGAGLSNMFFCKEKTNVIEVKCNRDWAFFNHISKNLHINHIKCKDNIPIILNYIKIYMNKK